MIEVERLTRAFGEYYALKDVSFTADRGEALLVLGPNGAGKTTLFRCLLGLIRFEGRVLVDGVPIGPDTTQVRARIGYVPQAVGFPRELKVGEVVRLHSRLYGVKLDLDEVLGAVGLEEEAESRIGELSGGMRQRLALSLVDSHDPDILILDEPLANLDAGGRAIFHRKFKAWRDAGKTILVSIHRVSEILPYSDKVLILNDGERVYHAPVEDFTAKLGSARLRLRVDGEWVTVEASRLLALLEDVQARGLEIQALIGEEPTLDELVKGVGEG